MWKSNTLKKKTRTALRKNYWNMIAVCFLAAMLTTTYTTSTTFITRYDPVIHEQDFSDASTTAGQSNSEVISDTVGQIAHTEKTNFFPSSHLNMIADFFINLYTSGKSVFFSVLRVINSLISDPSYLPSLLLSAGVITAFLYQVFFANIILIGERRFFLEARNYKDTRISKIFYLYKLRFIRNPAWIMLCRTIYQWLWNLTIVGGIIKYFEYSMIPFLLAENPAITHRDAFQLSKQLMRGNKWKMFLLQLSFLGWNILALSSFGLLDFLFVNPYITGTRAELYMELRRNYIRSRAAGYELFNDSMLDHIPSDDELLISKALYDDSDGPYTKTSYFAPNQYPVFLYSIQPPVQTVKPPAKVDKKYSLTSCIFLFFLLSILGWVVENAIYMIRDGVFINSGFLYGPWLPPYGLCGVICLLFIKKLASRPVLSFTVMTVTYTLMEYIISLFLDRELHIIKADSSRLLLNMDGRTFLGGAVFFALIGCAFLYYIAPRWDALFLRLSLHSRICICILLCILFICDIIYSLFYLGKTSELPFFSFVAINSV